MRLVTGVVVAALLATPGLTTRLRADAHEKFKIVGTVVTVKSEEIAVKAVDGATYEMDFLDSAPVFRQNRKVPRSELKPGVKVTVNALGHDMFDLEVVEVHITP